ncbi:MAG: O-antigen ligase family protein [Clostridia bacterium]|nr:O-antigen ligase family protein [Clostridia bacterium]
MLNKVKEYFESIIFIPITLLMAYLFWVLDLNTAMILFLAVNTVLILLLCSDIKNIFCTIFYCSFFIDDIFENPAWVLYGICIGIIIASFIYCIVKNVLKFKRENKKISFGKMAIRLLFADIAFLMGGVFYSFDFITTLIVFGCCFATYLLYFLARNFTKDLWQYLLKLFVIGASVICLQVFTLNIKANGIKGIFIFYVTGSGWIGAQNSNVAMIYVLMGLISAFALGYKNKFDYLFVLVAGLFMGTILVVKCRCVLLISIPAFVSLAILLLIKSKNKLYTGFMLIAFLIATICVFVFSPGVIQQFKARVMTENTSGRTGPNGLWSWCLEQFNNSKLFGVGFINKAGEVRWQRAGASKFILAHNTVIQWLCSLGIFGTVLMIVYYIGKYKTVIFNFTKPSFFISFILIAVALTGTFDQAAAMDFFVFNMPLTMIASIERRDKKEKMKI